MRKKREKRELYLEVREILMGEPELQEFIKFLNQLTVYELRDLKFYLKTEPISIQIECLKNLFGKD